MNKIQKSILLIICGILTISFGSSGQSDFSKSAISIGIVVEDLNKSLEFYYNVVGMVKVREFTVDSEKAKRMGLSRGESFDIKVLKLENSGIRYITIFVKSMTPVIERIKKHSVKMLGETPTMLDENRQFVLIKDPDGNFVEFIGPK